MADADLGSLVAKLAYDLSDLKKGLQEGKAELTNFCQLAKSAGEQVKKSLPFAGISLGLYEILSQLNAFTNYVIEVGAKTEMLRAFADALGQHFCLSASIKS